VVQFSFQQVYDHITIICSIINETKLKMKMKLFFLAGGMFFLTAVSTAQHGVRWGVKAGANFATVNTESSAPDWGSRIGVHAGLLAHIHLSKNWALQPELVYSLQGSKNTVGSVKQTNNLHYVNVPVLVQYMFNNGFRLQTGPQIGFLAGANTKISGGTSTSNSDLYNNTDFSWSFGGGYLTNTGLGIDARYNIGLNDVYKPGAMKETNSVIQLGLFYMFNHKSK